MRHMRRDFDWLQVQDVELYGDQHDVAPPIIDPDEPVFLIRARDRAGIEAVRHWARVAQGLGVAPEVTARATAWASEMEAWAAAHGGVKAPDCDPRLLTPVPTPDQAAALAEVVRMLREQSKLYVPPDGMHVGAPWGFAEDQEREEVFADLTRCELRAGVIVVHESPYLLVRLPPHVLGVPVVVNPYQAPERRYSGGADPAPYLGPRPGVTPEGAT